MTRFTKDERRVLTFLIAVLFLGMGIAFVRGRNPVPSAVISVDTTTVRSSEKININSAPLSELIKLDGIGPALAERIIVYRKINGLFRYPEDIKNVKGIGDKTFEKLRDQIVTE